MVDAPTEPDPWTEALERIEAAVRLLAVVDVDAPPRPELPPERASDVERAALAAERALRALNEAAVEVRAGRALTAFQREGGAAGEERRRLTPSWPCTRPS